MERPLLAELETVWSEPSCGPGRSVALAVEGFLLAATDTQVATFNDSLPELLRRCGEGDRAAFRAIYEAQSPLLYGVALRMTRDATLAADAVHDALLQVWQRSTRFDTRRGSAQGWLTSLVRYRAIDLLRKRGRESLSSEVPEQVDEAPDPLQALLATRDGNALRHCLATLEEAQRRLILFAFVDGLSHSQLATRIAAPLGTIKSRMRRGLLALKACLQP